MKKTTIIFFLLLFTNSFFATNGDDTAFVERKIALQTKTGEIFGTITTPKNFQQIPIALIIAGSGPTDRNGNNPMMKNNSLEMLAHELAKNGIASLRYDKRGIAESKAAGKEESELRFDDYVNDAKDWIVLLKNDKRFTEVTVIGHSEGSTIGMIAALIADKYVSIAGPGQSADKILKAQLSTQPKEVQDLCMPMIDTLKSGKLIANVNPMLYSLFRPSVQPYMISWFNYDPQIEIKKLTIPVLIVQGTNDIQVTEDDAKRLSKASKKSELVFIKGMNHIFRIIDGDKQVNIASYSQPELPIATELVTCITKFILKPRKK